MESASSERPDVPARDAPLCGKCRVIFDRWHERPCTEGIGWLVPDLKYTISHLLEHAKSCPSCYLLTGKYLDESVPDGIKEALGTCHLDFVEEIYLPGRILRDYRIAVTFRIPKNKKQYEFLSYHVREDPENNEVTTNLARTISERSDDTIALSQAKAWMNSCLTLQSHAICRTKIMDRVLPARLIYIANHIDEIHLCKTKDVQRLGGEVRYAALTHCWGTNRMPHLTTAQNLHQMLGKIPFHALGETFQHAILFCQRLGLEYLWIDSLCIVQNDRDDWEDQAAVMGSIFAGCEVNIVAGASYNGSQGLFSNLRRDFQGGSGFTTMANNGESRKATSVYAVARPDIPGLKMSTFKRAWCFQETFLAPRSLYFHSKGVYWQCRGFSASEIFPSGLFSRQPLRTACVGKVDEPSADLIPRSGLPQYVGSPSTGQQPSSATLTWMRLVMQYSMCDITYWKDRLTAFSGIARLICTRYRISEAIHEGDEAQQHYVAGLLYSDLREQLPWRAYGHKARPEPCFAPSWSWASVHARVYFPYTEWEKYEANFTIQSARTDLLSVDPYGAVEKGQLRLICNPLVRASIVSNLDEALEEDRYRLLHDEGLLQYSSAYWDAPDPGPEVFAFNGWKEMGKYGSWLHGLMLLPTKNAHEYRRVGAYQVILSNGSIDIQRGEGYVSVPSETILPFAKAENQVSITII